MKPISERRKKFMAKIDGIFNNLDPSGANTKRYHDLLDPMTDEAFDKWVRAFAKDDKHQFYFEIVEYVRDVKYENIEKAAKFLKVPLFERVYLPHINHDLDNITVTPEPVMVGYIHEKRMMQMLSKKNSGSTSIKNRSPLTGTVKDDDKNGRNSDVETYSMLASGAEASLAEFLGPRADDMTAKNQMYSSLAENGYVSLKDLTSDKRNKTSLNTLNIYFLQQGFKTNLIGSGNLLPQQKNEDKTNKMNSKEVIESVIPSQSKLL